MRVNAAFFIASYLDYVLAANGIMDQKRDMWPLRDLLTTFRFRKG